MNTDRKLDGVADFAVPIADAAMAVIEQIPVLGIAVGMLRGYDKIRDHVFEQKIRSFFAGLGSKSDEEIGAMASRCEDPKEAKAVGETLLLTLDRLSSLLKCEYLGVLFIAYLKRKISAEQLRRLALAIDGAFEDDLAEFLIWDPPYGRQLRNVLFYKHLERIGLTAFHDPLVMRGGMTDPPAMQITPLGAALRNAYWEVRPSKEMEDWKMKLNAQRPTVD
jgi:hypothetical protein